MGEVLQTAGNGSDNGNTIRTMQPAEYGDDKHFKMWEDELVELKLEMPLSQRMALGGLVAPDLKFGGLL